MSCTHSIMPIVGAADVAAERQFCTRVLRPAFGLADEVPAVQRFRAFYESLDDDEKWALWRQWRLFLLRHSVKRP